MNGKKYCLKMTTEQAKEVLNSVDLFLRLKIGQYDQLQYRLISVEAPDFGERREKSRKLLQDAFWAMNPDGYKKDREWYVLYNILQVIRHAIQQEEAPNSKGVDSYPPMDFDGVGMPGIFVEEAKNE